MKKLVISSMLVLLLLSGVAQAGLLEDFFSWAQRTSGTQAIYSSATTEASCLALNCQEAVGYTSGSGFACSSGTGKSYNYGCFIATAGADAGKCFCAQTACISSIPTSCQSSGGGTPTACGNVGQVCCSGSTCNSGNFCSSNICYSNTGTSTQLSGSFQLTSTVPQLFTSAGGHTSGTTMNVGDPSQIYASFTATATGNYIVGAKIIKISSILYVVAPAYIAPSSSYCNPANKLEATQSIYLQSGQTVHFTPASPIPNSEGTWDVYLVAYKDCSSSPVVSNYIGSFAASGTGTYTNQCGSGIYRCTSTNAIEYCNPATGTWGTPLSGANSCSSSEVCQQLTSGVVCQPKQVTCPSGQILCSGVCKTGTTCDTEPPADDKYILCVEKEFGNEVPNTYSCIAGDKPFAGSGNCEDINKNYKSGPYTKIACDAESERLNGGGGGDDVIDTTDGKYALCSKFVQGTSNIYCQPTNDCSGEFFSGTKEVVLGSAIGCGAGAVAFGVGVGFISGGTLAIPGAMFGCVLGTVAGGFSGKQASDIFGKGDGVLLRKDLNISSCNVAKADYGFCEAGIPGFKEGERFTVKESSGLLGLAYNFKEGTVPSKMCCEGLDAELYADSSNSVFGFSSDEKAYVCKVSFYEKIKKDLAQLYKDNPYVVYGIFGFIGLLLFSLVKGTTK